MNAGLETLLPFGMRAPGAPALAQGRPFSAAAPHDSDSSAAAAPGEGDPAAAAAAGSTAAQLKPKPPPYRTLNPEFDDKVVDFAERMFAADFSAEDDEAEAAAAAAAEATGEGAVGGASASPPPPPLSPALDEDAAAAVLEAFAQKDRARQKRTKRLADAAGGSAKVRRAGRQVAGQWLAACWLAVLGLHLPAPSCCLFTPPACAILAPTQVYEAWLEQHAAPLGSFRAAAAAAALDAAGTEALVQYLFRSRAAAALLARERRLLGVWLLPVGACGLAEMATALLRHPGIYAIGLISPPCSPARPPACAVQPARTTAAGRAPSWGCRRRWHC